MKLMPSVPKSIMFNIAIAFALAAVAIPARGRADETKPNPAAVPKPRDPDWVKRHEAFADIARKGNIDLLFMGDSITNRWRNAGQKAWEKDFAPLKAANFGMGGDCTQHVLWRLQNGELDGIKPKLMVLLIGTNNLSGNKDEEIAGGIKTIVADVRKQRPETKILLLGIFPRGRTAKDPYRRRIAHINSLIAPLDDGGKTVKYLDIGPKFLAPDGTLPKSVMPDALHPSTKGFDIFAEAIAPAVREMMK